MAQIILSNHTQCGHCHHHGALASAMVEQHKKEPKGFICHDLLVSTMKKDQLLVMRLHYCFAWWADEGEDEPSLQDCVRHQNNLYIQGSDDRVSENDMFALMLPIGEPMAVVLAMAA